MDNNFLPCVSVIFGAEGGYANDPRDNGGPTNMGITHGTLDAARRARPSAGYPSDVRRLTRAQALDIYHADFWAASGGVWSPKGLDLVLFNIGVLSGPRRAIKLLQKGLGFPLEKQDGVAGPYTQAAALTGAGATLALRVNALHLAYCKGLDDWPHFGGGWTNRSKKVAKFAAQMAA